MAGNGNIVSRFITVQIKLGGLKPAQHNHTNSQQPNKYRYIFITLYIRD